MFSLAIIVEQNLLEIFRFFRKQTTNKNNYILEEI